MWRKEQSWRSARGSPPWHPRTLPLAASCRSFESVSKIEQVVSRKDNQLLSLLRDVNVNSKDPVPSLRVKDVKPQQKAKEFRLPIGEHFDKNIMDIPKGKITVVEAVTLLNYHKLSPETWTAEKITQEYHLELKDVNSLLKYFITFEVKVFPPEDKKAIQSK